MPGFYDKLMGGLLGPTTNYGGILDPQAEAQARQQAQMAMYAQLLASSGYSDRPVTLGQAVGGAMGAGQQAQNRGLQEALQAQLLKSEIARASKQDLPTSAQEFEFRQALSPEDRDVFDKMRAKSGPAAIQEFLFFQNLPPEDQQTYIKLQRQPTVPKVVMIGNVPHLVDPVTGTRTPLSSLEQEASGAATVKGAEAEAAATGKGVGEVAADIQKKGSNAEVVFGLLDEADKLLSTATGSGAGALLDKGAAAVGVSTQGAQSTAGLRVIQAGLMMNMPRMEGPQGEKDVELYQQAAAQIGDDKVPTATRRAAMQVIRNLQNKYAERAQRTSPSQQKDDPLGLR